MTDAKLQQRTAHRHTRETNQQHGELIKNLQEGDEIQASTTKTQNITGTVINKTHHYQETITYAATIEQEDGTTALIQATWQQDSLSVEEAEESPHTRITTDTPEPLVQLRTM